MVTHHLRRMSGPLSLKVGHTLGKSGITANFVTVTGLMLALVATGLCAAGHLVAAGIVLILSGLCDVLDGAIAKSGHHMAKAGAYLDSTCDRLADGSMFAGIAWWSHATDEDWAASTCSKEPMGAACCLSLRPWS